MTWTYALISWGGIGACTTAITYTLLGPVRRTRGVKHPRYNPACGACHERFYTHRHPSAWKYSEERAGPHPAIVTTAALHDRYIMRIR